MDKNDLKSILVDQPHININRQSSVFKTSLNKRLSQQPALGALTLLRSFVIGKANFCSHLLASLVHFTVVKSQAILIIRLGVTDVIYHSSWGCRSYFRRNYIYWQLQNDEISTSLDMFRHNNFACGLCLSIVALTATMVEAPLTILYYGKRQVFYSKRVQNEFCRVAGFLKFTMVNFAVSCVGNSGNMKG